MLLRHRTDVSHKRTVFEEKKLARWGREISRQLDSVIHLSQGSEPDTFLQKVREILDK